MIERRRVHRAVCRLVGGAVVHYAGEVVTYRPESEEEARELRRSLRRNNSPFGGEVAVAGSRWNVSTYDGERFELIRAFALPA